jgi:hypothetical protein
MSEHTPTPWRNDQKPDALIVCDAEGGSIADCAPPGPWMSHKVALANAAFIVKAVNNHDALVKALDGMVNMYADLVNSGDAGFWDPEKVDEVIAARDALRSVGTPCK